MHPMLNIAIRAARKAGDIIINAQDRLDRVNLFTKGDNDCVTDIDSAAEQAIIDILLDAYPSHHILAEESGETGSESDYVWIIDPLDGTRNFIHGIPHFCISIALQHRGKIVLGVVYDPVRQELFTAEKGGGARLNDKRIRVSERHELKKALLGTGFPYRADQSLSLYLSILENILPATAGLRRAGAAALDLAYVAAGRFDGFWELGLKPWDLAAGILLIREAGGLISDLQGGESYFQTGDIVAGNPKIFKAMLTTMAPAVMEYRDS